jgi:hypothetical protein
VCAVFCRSVKAVQANEDPRSFQTLAWVFRGLAVLKVTVTVRFHRPVRAKEVVVLRVVFLVVLPTIK